MKLYMIVTVHVTVHETVHIIIQVHAAVLYNCTVQVSVYMQLASYMLVYIHAAVQSL